MKSFEKKYLDELRIPNSLISTIREIGECKGRQELYKKQSPDMLENLKKIAIIKSTECSNRLEGITAPKKRIKELVEEKTLPTNRSEAEIAGYRDVLNTIHINSRNIPFNEGVILQLHRDLMKYTTKEGGRWKSVPNEISEFLPDGSKRIRFVPVEPFQTAEYMRMLHMQFNQLVKERQLDLLILIPLYILDFLCIHPFLDGNGRMGRLLSVLLLYHQDYDVVRYISLERIVEKTRGSYYEVLNTSSRNWHESGHNALPWIEYFLSTVLAAYKEFEERVGKVASGYGSKADMVISAIDGFISDFTLSDLEGACPVVGRDWVRKLLQKLKKEGKIESIGKGRYAKWRKLQ